MFDGFLWVENLPDHIAKKDKRDNLDPPDEGYRNMEILVSFYIVD